MKILWITEFFPASDKGEITGGVEARCFVKKYLKKLGNDVTIIGEKTTGKRWAHLSFRSLGAQIIFLSRIFLQTLQKVGSDFDIVEGTNYPTYFFAWLLGIVRRKPIIFWYPDVFRGHWVENIGPAGLLGEIVESIVLMLPGAQYIAISHATKEKLVKWGVSANKIKVIYCGVDAEEIKSIASPEKKKYDISLVSRLVSYKRVIDAVEALSLIVKKMPKASMVIVGQGPERSNIEKRARELDLEENVKLVGHVPAHKDVLKTIAESRVFCFPTAAEGFGIAAIEAAALGIPSVVSDIPVLLEVTKNGCGGQVFKLGDANDLAKQTIELLTDTNLYRKKAQAAKTLAKAYYWENIASQTEKIYENLHAY